MRLAERPECARRAMPTTKTQRTPEQQVGPAPNSGDAANNARLLRELHDVPDEYRTGRFVCVIAAARNGHTLATFHGRAEGLILRAPRGSNGFGYDPLFYFPEIGKTFAELTAEEKARYSHRGAAFRQFLQWEDESPERHPHDDSESCWLTRLACSLGAQGNERMLAGVWGATAKSRARVLFSSEF